MLVAGNWKMNTSVKEGVELAHAIRHATHDVSGADIAVLPPFTHLWPVCDALKGSRVMLGAQDVFWEDWGAFTGEISPAMLVGCCQLVLVGHSERRHILGESDEAVGRKFARANTHGLCVIVAVGETEEERDAGQTFEVVDRQLEAAFTPFEVIPDAGTFVIAYEPVWAIGTGRTATPHQANEVCAHIKERLAQRQGVLGVRVLYGGSVTPENSVALFAEPHIDGALVGGASLKAADFTQIIRATVEVVQSQRV